MRARSRDMYRDMCDEEKVSNPVQHDARKESLTVVVE